MDMVNTNYELILQHPCPLFTHAGQHFFPSFFVTSILTIVDSHAKQSHNHNPEHKKPWEPSFVRMNEGVPSFGPHLLIQSYNHRMVALHLHTHFRTRQKISLLRLLLLPPFVVPSLTTAYLSLKEKIKIKTLAWTTNIG